MSDFFSVLFESIVDYVFDIFLLGVIIIIILIGIVVLLLVRKKK